MLSIDATLLEQMFVPLGFRQALASELFFWRPFTPPPVCVMCHHQAKLLFFAVNWCDTSRFPSAGEFKYGLVSLMHPWNIAVDVAEVWTIYRVWGLGKASVSGVSTLICECESNCVENQTGSSIELVLLYQVWKRLCYWDIDAAVGMKTVEMQKLPCVEKKTSHEVERNKMKNLSIPCLKEVGKDFGGELSLICS